MERDPHGEPDYEFAATNDHERLDVKLAAARTAAERAEAAAEMAQAEAERSSLARDRFLAVLSHELRMPLTPVVMTIAMLQDRTDLDADVRASLEVIRRNVETEVQLIDDLLDVARVECGKIELHRATIDLCAAIERAVEVCKPEIDAQRLAFHFDRGPSPYWMHADAMRLQQIFWNLIRNAVKFTPPGGCIGVRCEPCGDCIAVEVSDTGIGIDANVLPRIFDAFEQGEPSITRQFGGLGLGLSISKTLVEIHGGTIAARSDGHACGATFRVELPLASAPHGDRRPPSPAVRRVTRDLRILLVEDHPVTAKIVSMLLVSAGHKVTIAADESAAIELSSQREFDLLISDLGLPGGSGLDLLRDLRARGHNYPAIALSGYGRKDDVRQSGLAGFAAHLTKPASRESILNAIASIDSRPTDER